MKYKAETHGFDSVINTGSFLSPSLLSLKNTCDTSTSGHTHAVKVSYSAPSRQFHTHIVTILSYFLNYEATRFEFTL